MRSVPCRESFIFFNSFVNLIKWTKKFGKDERKMSQSLGHFLFQRRAKFIIDVPKTSTMQQLYKDGKFRLPRLGSRDRLIHMGFKKLLMINLPSWINGLIRHTDSWYFSYFSCILAKVFTMNWSHKWLNLAKNKTVKRSRSLVSNQWPMALIESQQRLALFFPFTALREL